MRGCRQEGREGLSGRWMRALPVSYALFAGLLGTQSVVFCKSLSTLLRTTLAGDSQLGSVFFWGLMAAFLGTAAFWVNRLNQVTPPCALAWAALLPSSLAGMGRPPALDAVAP